MVGTMAYCLKREVSFLLFLELSQEKQQDYKIWVQGGKNLKRQIFKRSVKMLCVERQQKRVRVS